MFDFGVWAAGLGVILLIVLAVWAASIPLRNASIIDPFWSLLFVAALLTYVAVDDVAGGSRVTLLVVLVTVWGLRLAAYLFWRAAGEPEDKRYQAMRKKQGPTFPVKSLVTVFAFQGLLAWVISLPLLGTAVGGGDIGALDLLAVVVWLVGFVFEAGGDYQLARFKADPSNEGEVLDSGLWRYTRHPNYFGDAVMWWAYYLIAVAAGAWWSIIGPAIMTWLLMRFSGVTLLERGLERTRPQYADYVARTNTFFPGPPRD